MRQLQLGERHAALSESEYTSGSIIGGGSPDLVFFVCALLLPTALAACTWRWRWRIWGPALQNEQYPPASVPSGGQARIPIATSAKGPHPAPARDSASAKGAGDTEQFSIARTECTMPSVQPGQLANPVSLPSHIVAKAGRPSIPRAALRPSYESDDGGKEWVPAEERLNDITRSFKSHANAAGAGSVDELARRQGEDAAKRRAAEGGLPVASQDNAKGVVVAAETEGPGTSAAVAATAEAASGPSGVASAADTSAAAAPPPMPAVPTEVATPAAGRGDLAAGEAAVAAPVVYDIDLHIDLTKGDLKVDYTTRGLLGQGGFAAVYKGRYKGERVAVKMIKKTAGSSLADLQEDVRALMHELHILRQVNHPNIVTLYGGCLTPPHIFLVEERMEGTLDFYVHQVRKQDALSVREVVYFALDIASGLSYLHPRIVHRDLKPANVLLSREGRCKISDFGLARTKMKEYLSTKNLDAGTTAYIAPECFISMDNPDLHDLRRSVTDRTDVYALGIIMWELLAGKRPWQGLKPLLVAYQVAYRSLRPPLFELGARCPLKLRQLVEECWCQEPKLRPSSQQAVERLLEILDELPPEQDFPVVYQQPESAPPPLLLPVVQQQRPQAMPVAAAFAAAPAATHIAAAALIGNPCQAPEGWQ